MSSPSTHLLVEPRAVVRNLGVSLGALILAAVLALVLRFRFGHDYVVGFVPLFDMDSEYSLPTLFNTALLLAATVLLAIIARVRFKRGERFRRWGALALIFGFLTIDEACSIHEQLIAPVREALHTTGALSFAWVIPYGLLVILFAVSYAPFVWSIPSPVRNLMMAGFFVYICGAIGVEMISSWYYSGVEVIDVTYASITLVEESIEMCGMIIFVYALMTYLVSVLPGATVRIGTESPATS